MHTYKLYVPGKWLIFIILGLQTCVFAAMAVWGLVAPERGGPPVLLTPFFILFPALLWYQALSVPHTIVLDLDNNVSFISVLRTKRFNLSEVKSIRPRGNHFGFFVVDFGHGKQRFLGQFTGFHDFLARLKAVNVNAVLLGC